MDWIDVFLYIFTVPKNLPKKHMVTTGSLMLEESCALVNTLPNWQVVGKVSMMLYVI